MDQDLAQLSERIGCACRNTGVIVATAESCTGGWVAEVITHTSGSSGWFDCGFITYTNAAKAAILGVRLNTIEACGAVSLETAGEMAQGALKHSSATISVAITGIAGPTGGSPDKPVGTVCFGWCDHDREGRVGTAYCERRLFLGDRESIRKQSVIHALSGLLDMIERARNMP